MRARAASLALLLLLGASGAARGGEVVAVIHPSNTARKLNALQLRSLYQLQRTRWPNREPVKLVLPVADDPALPYLAGELLSVRDAGGVARYYLEAVFRQRSSEVPPQLAAEAALAYVAREPGGIALMDEAAAKGATNVKVVKLAE
jgi:hypothetical protein